MIYDSTVGSNVYRMDVIFWLRISFSWLGHFYFTWLCIFTCIATSFYVLYCIKKSFSGSFCWKILHQAAAWVTASWGVWTCICRLCTNDWDALAFSCGRCSLPPTAVVARLDGRSQGSWSKWQTVLDTSQCGHSVLRAGITYLMMRISEVQWMNFKTHFLLLISVCLTWSLMMPDDDDDGSRWPSGDALASDASGWVNSRGTLQLDTVYHPLGSVKYEATSRQWVTAVENCGCKCSKCGSALEGIKREGGM